MSFAESASSDQLPIPDYNHLPLGDVQTRIRTLDSDQLEEILEYEQRHNARPPVLLALEHRRAELAGGAQPSGGNPAAAQPETAPPPQTEPDVSPATAGPKQNPPSQGAPENPAQPRPTG